MPNVITFPPRATVARPKPSVRDHIETALEKALDGVDSLVALLDQLDGDPDLEDGGDAEPSLGAPEGHASQIVWLRGGDQDREKDITPCA